MKKLDKPMRRKVMERFYLMTTQEFHPLLKNHKLHHPYEGCWGISITGDWRLIYKNLGPDMYQLRAVGTHHQLFGT